MNLAPRNRMKAMRIGCLLFFLTTMATAGPVDFVREVRPILEKRCYECHGPDKQKNGYRLDLRQAAFTGGEHHAPNILPGKSQESPLFRFISGQEKNLAMPPKKPLSTGEIDLLKRWLDEGAVWPEGVDTAKVEDRTDWWSFKALPTAPAVPIDDFIRATLAKKGWEPAPAADARTLIRRLSFDLIGLPPTPEEVATFEKDHRLAPDRAYEQLVDRLLASPRHGERWARHWLDAVHYGETHGYDKDKPRNNAWPYRDYVIRALNADKPYARFLEEQIAGDVIYPGTIDGITALGFISAGPWDLIGHMEVPESKTDGKIARHLDRDDMVQNAIGTLCSLTVQCAQCHYHKFDPISQQDYYRLQAVFAALDRTELPFYADAGQMRQFHDLQTEQKQLAKGLRALEQPLITQAGKQYQELTRRLEGASQKTTAKLGNAKPDFGYHSALTTTQNQVKWVQVDLGQRVPIQRIILRPCYDDYNQIGAGFGFPIRFKVEASDDPEFKTGVTLLWQHHDATFMNDFKNPGLTPFETKGAVDDGVAGRFVRVTAVKLAARMNDYMFALSEIEVQDAAGKNRALGRPVQALDSIESAPRWRRANLTDGIAPEPPAKDEKEQLTQQRDDLILAQASPEQRAQLKALLQKAQAVDTRLKALPPPLKVYAGGIHHGTGAFRGTGHLEGKPRSIHVLKRGDVKTPDAEVQPGTIEALSKLHHLPAEFIAITEGERRAALARWITAPQNPLTWRSITNRVWLHHFGRGLVETANDFGRMGAEPSHPELLDSLAAWFRDEAQGSLKALHKRIVMSHTYRQASVHPQIDSPAQALDSENRFLWRQNRRKLDAEAIRDSLLSVSGKLDLTMGGPSFQDFVIEKPQHSPHYQYHLHDLKDPKAWRRSIYRFIVRSQQQPFMTVLDCADPSMRVDRRNESQSALQALAMLNNGLVVTQAEQLASRVERESSGLESQLQRAFELTLARSPTQTERQEMLLYTREHGLANLCRLLLNTNEFVYVD